MLPHFTLSSRLRRKDQVVPLFDSGESSPPEEGAKVPRPVVLLDDGSAVFKSHELADVAGGRVVDHSK